MKFFDKYGNKPVKKPEMNPGGSITEKAGYVPAKVQIENMINAGKRLQEYRKEMYDFEDESSVDDSYVDPTRNPGFDMADAHQMSLEVNRRLRKAKKEAEDAPKRKKDDVSGSNNGNVEKIVGNESKNVLSGSGSDRKGDKDA